jgi:hypothetical protein
MTTALATTHLLATQGPALGGLSPAGLERYAALTPGQKQRVRDYLETIFPALERARTTPGESMGRAAEALARHFAARAAGKTHSGYSPRSMCNKFERFRREGTGDFLIPAYRDCGRRDRVKKMSWDAFARWWVNWATSNQRDEGTRAAYDMFIRDLWAGGQRIPGFGTWQEWWLREHPTKPLPPRCPTGKGDLPRGWSYENLLRLLPRKSVVTSLRKGFAAAHQHQAIMRRSRADLLPLQYIAIDDFWTDQYVYVDGQAQPCRCVGILAIDVATGLVLGHFLKPRTEDEYGKREGIRAAEVRELILLIIQSIGLPTWTVTFIAEHGSAAISAELEGLLDAHLGDAVEVWRTGLYHDFMRKHGFEEKGGKPWIKGWVEAFFRVLHTHAGHLPGQTGPIYNRKPADLDAKLAYTARLLANPDFTAEDKARLRLPLMHIREAQATYGRIIRLLDERTDHRLRGFEQVREWRSEPGDPWHRADELPAHVDPARIDFRQRRESPAERFTRLMQGKRLRPVPDTCLYYLYPACRPVRIKNGQISFQDRALGPDERNYFDGSALLRENEGERLLAWYHPDRADHLLLTTREADAMARRWVGRVEAAPEPALDDKDALDRASGMYRADRMHDLRTARTITAPQDCQLKADKDFNRFLAAEAKERKQSAARGARRDGFRLDAPEELLGETGDRPPSRVAETPRDPGEDYDARDLL